MKVEVMALGKVADLDRALEMLGAEGRYERHVAREGRPLAGCGEAPTLVVDRLDSLASDLDAMRRAVNGLEVQGYDKVVFIAVLTKHDNFSKPDRKRIGAIERDVQIRKLVGRNKVHFDNLEFCPYIFVDTGFRRADQPVFVLALLENRRRIWVDRERREDLEYVANLAAAHYHDQQGELMLWGAIQHYHYHDGRGHLYLAEPDGRFVEVTGRGGLREGRASISMGMQLHQVGS